MCLPKRGGEFTTNVLHQYMVCVPNSQHIYNGFVQWNSRTGCNDNKLLSSVQSVLQSLFRGLESNSAPTTSVLILQQLEREKDELGCRFQKIKGGLGLCLHRSWSSKQFLAHKSLEPLISRHTSSYLPGKRIPLSTANFLKVLATTGKCKTMHDKMNVTSAR